MSTADERLLQERFAALAGPPDGDWRDVRRRARRRSGVVAVAAIAVVAALAAAGLAVGARVIGLFDVKGPEVPLSAFTQKDRQLLESMCPDPVISHGRGGAPRVACGSGEPTVRKIADDGVEVHWRVRYPWGLTCVASGPVGGRRNPAFGNAKITNLGCNAWAAGKKVVPTPQRPITVDAIIETAFGILKCEMGLEHSRHRSPRNAIVHVLSCLVAYAYRPGKLPISRKGKMLEVNP